MSSKQTLEVDAQGRKVEVYNPMARMFHWLTVGLIAVQIPIGLYMTYRGGDLNIWDATTNNLYSSHKLIGVIILLLIAARLTYRLTQGAPAHEPTLEPWQKIVSELTHWAIYALLIVVPVLGYLAISYFPALNIFGLFSFPGIVAPDKPSYEVVAELHEIGAIALGVLIAMHIGAALYHHIIRGDNVLARMIPGLLRNKK